MGAGNSLERACGVISAEALLTAASKGSSFSGGRAMSPLRFDSPMGESTPAKKEGIIEGGESHELVLKVGEADGSRVTLRGSMRGNGSRVMLGEGKLSESEVEEEGAEVNPGPAEDRPVLEVDPLMELAAAKA